MPYGAMTRSKRDGSKRNVADIAANEACTSRDAGAPRAAARAVEHRVGSVDADDRRARFENGYCDAAGAAPELEDRTRMFRGEMTPERHVTAAYRPGVLPVVEGRVLVPALPTFFGSSQTPGSG